MIGTYSLSDRMKKQFQEIHSDIFSKRRTKKFCMIEFYHGSDNLTEDHNMLLLKSIELLKMEGITDYDENVFCIDFHQRNCSENSSEKHYWSGWHKDDYSILNSPVYTILYYVRIDKTVKGGEFLYSNKSKKLVPEEGDILCFRGDLIHKPTPTWGFGCRDLIAIFIKRKVKKFITFL